MRLKTLVLVGLVSCSWSCIAQAQYYTSPYGTTIGPGVNTYTSPYGTTTGTIGGKATTPIPAHTAPRLEVSVGTASTPTQARTGPRLEGSAGRA